MEQTFATWGTLAGTIATAIATFFLWRVTKILAVETKRMADMAAQPQVVANIVLNQWAMNHVDLVVENTGNATAFDIQLRFDPPLRNGSLCTEDGIVPFQQISVLKPGQALSTYLTEVAPIENESFTITASWKIAPESSERQVLTYLFRMGDYAGMSRLGAADPAIQMAEQIKHIREDWRNIAGGQRKLKADVYMNTDRDNERAAIDERRKARQQPGSGTTP